MDTIRDFFVQTKTFVLFLACITIKNRLPVPLPLEPGFTLNAKAFPGTAPLVAKLGDRVKIRLANVSATDHHPIHLHGYQFTITETDGGPIPASAQQVETTVLVQVGSTRPFEFVADVPEDWALHCQ